MSLDATLGIVGAVTGVLSLVAAGASAVSSASSASAAKESSNASLWANANSLAPQIDLVAGKPEVRERWIWALAGVPTSPREHLPSYAQPRLQLTEPGFSNAHIAVAGRLRISNHGSARAFVKIDALCITTGDLGVLGSSLDMRSLVTNHTIELAGGGEWIGDVYAGLSIAQWRRLGSPAGEVKLLVPITATAGPDGAVRHWEIRMQAMLMSSDGQVASAVRVADARPPAVSCVELPRSLPDRADDR